MKQVEWKTVGRCVAQLGECPIWAGDVERLFWIDSFEPSINAMDPATGENVRWMLPSEIGSYGLSRDASQALLALRDGLHSISFATGLVTKIADAPYDMAHHRFNDGRVDQNGHFWVGTMRLPSSDQPDGSGAIWRWDGSAYSREIDGITVSNGIAWQADGRTLYVGDRPNWQILAFDFQASSASAKASNRRRFASLPHGHTPDGAAVDTEGRYWIALAFAGRIACFSKAGDLLHQIETPVSVPTMVAFGGKDLATLFVTTSYSVLTLDERSAQPLAGQIMCADVGARGTHEPRLAADIL